MLQPVDSIISPIIPLQPNAHIVRRFVALRRVTVTKRTERKLTIWQDMRGLAFAHNAVEKWSLAFDSRRRDSKIKVSEGCDDHESS